MFGTRGGELVDMPLADRQHQKPMPISAIGKRVRGGRLRQTSSQYKVVAFVSKSPSNSSEDHDFLANFSFVKHATACL